MGQSETLCAVLGEAKDLMKKRNARLLESLFEKHLRGSNSHQLWNYYLEYVQQNTTGTKETLKQAVEYAYQKTYLNVSSVDIKIRYLEIMMQTEEESIKEEYAKMLEIPLLRIETLIELYRTHEASKKSQKRGGSDLLPKEINAQEESKRLSKALSGKDLSEENVEALVEYVSKRYKDGHPMFSAEILLYTIDTGIELVPESAIFHMYKITVISKEDVKIRSEHMANAHTKTITGATGKVERVGRICEYLQDAQKKTNFSAALLFAHTSYHLEIEAVLKQAPPSITKKSESFYTVFFTALLKHKDVAHIRKYLVILSKEEKIGHAVYCFCASVEGLVANEVRHSGGILLTGLKMFLGRKDDLRPPYVSHKENAFRIASDGVKLLLSLGDTEQAGVLADTYTKSEGKEYALGRTEAKEETHPRLIFAKNQAYYKLGFFVIPPLLSEFTLKEAYDFLCRCYGIEESIAEIKRPEVVEHFISSLPPLRESQNICSNVNLDEFVKIMQEITIR